MKKTISEKCKRVIRNRIKLEEALDVKIIYRGKEISVEGSPENEEMAIQMIDALDFGLPFSEVISMKKEEKIFTRFNIKDHTSKKDLSAVRARIIGKDGKSLKSLSNISGCSMERKNNELGIVGLPEDIERLTDALVQIIHGGKHGHVYKILEESQAPPIRDLGLKKKDNKNL